METVGGIVLRDGMRLAILGMGFGVSFYED